MTDTRFTLSNLFVSNSGQMTCAAHGGMYLRTHLETYPEANRILTPLDVWERITEFEAASLRNDLDIVDLCERCAATLFRLAIDPSIAVSRARLRKAADRIADAYRGPHGLKMSTDDEIRILADEIDVEYEGWEHAQAVADIVYEFGCQLPPGSYTDERYWTDGEANGEYNFAVLVDSGLFVEATA